MRIDNVEQQGFSKNAKDLQTSHRARGTCVSESHSTDKGFSWSRSILSEQTIRIGLMNLSCDSKFAKERLTPKIIEAGGLSWENCAGSASYHWYG